MTFNELCILIIPIFEIRNYQRVGKLGLYIQVPTSRSHVLDHFAKQLGFSFFLPEARQVTMGQECCYSCTYLDLEQSGNSRIVSGLLPKETPPQWPAVRCSSGRPSDGSLDRPFASIEMAARLPSWVSHRKGKHTYPFLTVSNYVAFSVSVIKI